MIVRQFGKKAGGGRRRSDRKSVGLGATIRTLFGNGSLELADVSSTGGRLTGPKVPAVGQELLLRVETVEVYAQVVWSRPGLCGLRFENPISDEDLHSLQEEARIARLLRLSPEQKVAMNYWSPVGLC